MCSRSIGKEVELEGAAGLRFGFAHAVIVALAEVVSGRDRFLEVPTMNIKTLTTLAAAVLATSAWAAGSQDSKCGAGGCGKKESSTKEAKCSKKDGGCSKKDAGCSKKDGGCSKKDGAGTH